MNARSWLSGLGNQALAGGHRAVRTLLIGAVAAMLSSAAFAGEYRLRQTEPDLGSNIRRTIGATSIPLDRGYIDLSADEVTDLRARFASMPATDEPPFPANGLKPLVAAVSRMQHQLMIDGKLSVVVRVDANGAAQSVAVLDSPSYDLEALVGRALMDASYKPAKCGGKPCAMDLPFTLSLTR